MDPSSSMPLFAALCVIIVSIILGALCAVTVAQNKHDDHHAFAPPKGRCVHTSTPRIPGTTIPVRSLEWGGAKVKPHTPLPPGWNRFLKATVLLTEEDLQEQRNKY